jgi:hypothetical protein
MGNLRKFSSKKQDFFRLIDYNGIPKFAKDIIAKFGDKMNVFNGKMQRKFF